MQISTLTPRTELPPSHGPIGMGSAGTLLVGRSVDGVNYARYPLLMPMVGPVATYTGSLQDAITGAQALLARQEANGITRGALALLGLGNQWSARVILTDDAALDAIDRGAGHDGIATIEFTNAARSLGAVVTSTGAVSRTFPK